MPVNPIHEEEPNDMNRIDSPTTRRRFTGNIKTAALAAGALAGDTVPPAQAVDEVADFLFVQPLVCVSMRRRTP